MAQNDRVRSSPDWQDDAPLPYAEYEAELRETRPSLPIILISAVCGIAGGVVSLYVARMVLRWELPASVFVAVLGLCAGVGLAGAGLSILTDSRAAIANIVFSCGLIGATLVFFILCSLLGALGATLLFLH